MTVERSSLRRQGAEAADLLAKTEALLREVTGCIDRTEHEATHSKAVDTLSVMRKRKVDERAVKMNRARDRIEAENRARVEKALSAMRRLGQSNGSAGAGGDDDEQVARRLERAPAHLRPILAIFLSPSFKKAFLAYARQVALGEVTSPSAVAPTGATTALTGAPGSTGAAARGNPPPRRAISLDYPATCPGHEISTSAAATAAASVPALARGAGLRRQVAFGDEPPSKLEANLMAAGRQRSSMVAPGGRDSGTTADDGSMDDGRGSNGQNRRRSSTRSKRERDRQRSGVNRAAKWHKHQEGSDFNVTLTTDTASGRAGSSVVQHNSAGAGAGTTESGKGQTAAAAAAATAEAAAKAAEAVATRARQLKAHRKDLKKRE
ncbi:unnamed protein product, partial [Hapterophycus canaliculatus]